MTEQNKRRKLVNMQVPFEYEQKISNMLSELALCEDKTFEIEDSDDNLDVAAVVDHKVDRQGKWSFLLRFKGYSTPEWVDDENCNCEELIRDYLFNTNNNIRVVYLVCRVSSRRQSKYNKVSLDTQEMRLRHVVRKIYGLNQHIRIKVHQIAVSAYKQIPRVLSIIGDVAREKDVIMTYRVDRLSRNIFLSLGFLENLRERGVLIYVPEFGDEHNGLWYHEQRLQFIQSLLDANKEAELIGKRVKGAIAYRINRGDEAIGSVPYGFCLQREFVPDKTRVVDGINYPVTKCLRVVANEAEAKVIDQILDMCNQKNTIETIAGYLNANGLRKRNRLWTAKMVGNIIIHYPKNWRVSKKPGRAA